MEVGAVKQAFNNEVILLKKKLNQAKIQIIHKLTRKAKQLTEKKAPEQLKEKLKRKAESAIKEVLVIKKIKAKDLAKFMVTHKAELNSYLNKPQVDQDRACARLLLHKALQDKYKFIRGRFSDVPIQDLFMSRLERRKIKKEAKEKQKNKKKGKDSKVVNSEGDWNVEDIKKVNNKKLNDEVNDGDKSNENELSSEENDDNEVSDSESTHSDASVELKVDFEGKDEEKRNNSESEEVNSDNETREDVCKFIKPTLNVKPHVIDAEVLKSEVNIKPKEITKNMKPNKITKKNPIKKQKELNKNKNFCEKIGQRKLKKDTTHTTAVESKIVDPFFITSTGENYMSMVEPRAPDEIKDEHKQGNRQLRRAVMFGHTPKIKPRHNNNYYNKEDRFNKQNGYEKGNNFKSNFNDRPQYNDRKTFNNDFNNKTAFNNRNDRNNDDKPEKLHPSWEAKKKKSGILPFEGKKIVFDES